MQIGIRLATARKANALTQQQVADQLHLTRQTVSNWENERSYPDVASLIDLSNLYGLSLDILLKEDNKMTEKVRSDAMALKQARAMFWASWVIDVALAVLLILSAFNTAGFELGSGATALTICVLLANFGVLFPARKNFRRLQGHDEQTQRHDQLMYLLRIGVVGAIVVVLLGLVLLKHMSPMMMVGAAVGVTVGLIVAVIVGRRTWLR
ncbi:helix-turn-helix domain-containing protein [Lacticaseibacillus thailandensis]|uniref:HTH cro/C1-type domain-containing protein n=1 Tax=Lacticaseibacillus thailandensis DSM 22698 = JCM 13996 TaxID=1423810 RepID=A0A0R2CB71_9LACO|nr:helix-turn-helix transcriptional regulator [Lacticaseibacillus thailandensis]KRM87268.1 hypothetical protein FD19_GL001426 [Lacticaseibacillus thailandensis DSM 22698 = JCM 13996]